MSSGYIRQPMGARNRHTTPEMAARVIDAIRND